MRYRRFRTRTVSEPARCQRFANRVAFERRAENYRPESTRVHQSAARVGSLRSKMRLHRQTQAAAGSQIESASMNFLAQKTSREPLRRSLFRDSAYQHTGRHSTLKPYSRIQSIRVAVRVDTECDETELSALRARVAQW